MKPVMVCSCSFNMAKKTHFTNKKVLLYFIYNGVEKIVKVYHMFFNYYYAFPILILQFIGIPVRLRLGKQVMV